MSSAIGGEQWLSALVTRLIDNQGIGSLRKENIDYLLTWLGSTDDQRFETVQSLFLEQGIDQEKARSITLWALDQYLFKESQNTPSIAAGN